VLDGARILWPVLFLVAGAARFLPHQSLWVDETTQLSGIALAPGRLLRWLAGSAALDLGVPADRMPPLSYLLQMAWGLAAGTDEPAMRWLGICCVAVGVSFAALAAARAYGSTAGLGVALFLSLSPNVVVYAVEIRAYPAFLMFSGFSAYALVRTLEAAGRARRAWLGALSVAAVAAAYTHFFGVVLAGAVFAALLTEAVLHRRPTRDLWVAAGGVALAGLGLYPFVAAAVHISASGTPVAEPARLRALVKVVYRLYGHPAMFVSWPALVLATAGFLLLLGAALVVARRHEPVHTAALGALAAGFAAVAVTAFVTRGFDPANPPYNVWALPFCALALAAPLAAGSPALRGAAQVGGVLLLAGTLGAAAELQREPDLFAHGPQRRILGLVRELGPDRVALLFEPDSDAEGHVFFPVRYSFGRHLPQYRSLGTTADPVPFDPADVIPRFGARPLVIVMRVRHTPASELRATNERRSEEPSLPTAERLCQRGFTLLAGERIPGLASADLQVLRAP
jgi:hypothetical protein